MLYFLILLTLRDSGFLLRFIQSEFHVEMKIIVLLSIALSAVLPIAGSSPGDTAGNSLSFRSFLQLWGYNEISAGSLVTDARDFPVGSFQCTLAMGNFFTLQSPRSLHLCYAIT